MTLHAPFEPGVRVLRYSGYPYELVFLALQREADGSLLCLVLHDGLGMRPSGLIMHAKPGSPMALARRL